MIQHIVIPDKSAGERLDVALAKLTGISRSQLAKAFQSGRVLVDGNPVAAKVPVAGGMQVELTAEQIQKMPAAPELPVLYEDDDLMAVDKPAGLAVHLSESGRPQPTVAAFAANRNVKDESQDRPGIVHRLDKDTSGVLLIAKHPKAKEYLQQQFRERKVHKTYLALVRGRMEPAEATIKLPIARDRKQPTKRAVVPGGRASVTHYRVMRQYDGYALLEIELETGRTHQIRVHFAHLGHPVVGDALYGGPSVPGLSRQFLHAANLKLIGPGGKQLDISSKLPPDLQGILDWLGNAV